MAVLTSVGRFDLHRRAEKALSSARFVMDDVASAKECLQTSDSFWKLHMKETGMALTESPGSNLCHPQDLL
jgi:hypothetical protein